MKKEKYVIKITLKKLFSLLVNTSTIDTDRFNTI